MTSFYAETWKKAIVIFFGYIAGFREKGVLVSTTCLQEGEI